MVKKRPTYSGWKRYLAMIFVCLLLFISSFASESPKKSITGRNPSIRQKTSASSQPNVQVALHSVGDVWLTVSNNGQFGTGYLGPQVDPISGLVAPSCNYPAYSGFNHLYVGGFWIGAVVGRDTLVSAGVDDYYNVLELWPDAVPNGGIIRRSINPDDEFYSTDAKSEQDIIAKYTDTVTNPTYVSIDAKDGRPHIPLNIEVIQRSYVWSYEYARDFILFDYSIKNIGRKDLEETYMAIYIDGDVHHESKTGEGAWTDDLCGFRRTYPSNSICNTDGSLLDSINIAYITDNDGDPSEVGDFSSTSIRSVAGVRVVRTPSDSLEYSFNWWITNYSSAALDFGPRKSGTTSDPFRDMGVLGTPLGDRNKYYIMRHNEFDYDQLFTGIDHTNDGWLPKPTDARNFANGFDARYLLSFGPFDISPGEVLPVSFAFVCGQNLHSEANDFKDYFDPNNPKEYYSKLNFEDLARNSVWASWVYDNPGYDTNNDDYLGKYHSCCSCDSIERIDSSVDPPQIIKVCPEECLIVDYYQGDNAPDFRGARPPEPPKFWVKPKVNEYNEGEMHIRINGFLSETTLDEFSNEYDFEGYRIYMGLSPAHRDFVVLTSYDREDYNRFEFDSENDEWRLLLTPFTLEELQEMYGIEFNPANHSIDDLYYDEESDKFYYFTPQDANQSSLDNPYMIHKTYPEEPPPTVRNLNIASLYYPEELTEDGYFKYYEYEHTITKLLPSQLYYISVTAFDYGSPSSGLQALETALTQNMISEYAQNSAEIAEQENLEVIAYPNPYRGDAGYNTLEAGGFEGRLEGQNLPDERQRAIHFINLPHKCTIRIFSIDGDLVRQIEHNYAPGSPQAMHETWDMVTRNTQAVVSGIYYYSVDSQYGNQIGKLVIIL